jgi:sugar phosphate isomerase/epimerase
MRRREFLGAGLAAPAALYGKNRIDRSRVSAITDEIARSPAEAIAFARQYRLKWLELRGVPGAKKSYTSLSEAEIRAAAKEFDENGIRISFLNTGLLKFHMPGTELARKRNETPEQRAKREASDQRQFDNRMADLRQAIRTAHILGTDKVRVFTFFRVVEPEALFPRIGEILGEMALVAEKEKIRLLIENEGACNAVSCRETAELLKLLPSRAIGINWDPMNGLAQKETPYPDGYALLPKTRIGNVQIKGRSLLPGPQLLDWKAIFAALAKDGYQGQVGLETHIFDDRLIEHSHESMKEILRIVES